MMSVIVGLRKETDRGRTMSSRLKMPGFKLMCTRLQLKSSEHFIPPTLTDNGSWKDLRVTLQEATSGLLRTDLIILTSHRRRVHSNNPAQSPAGYLFDLTFLRANLTPVLLASPSSL